MILFKKVKFKNFGSFGNVVTEISLDKNSTTLICGNNGSGKSFAFLDSITYALFGKSFRKVNIPQLANSINTKNCLVEIEFSKGTDTYIVKRGLNPKLFEIYKNDVLLNQNSSSIDYQRILEDSILKMTYKTFTQVVILGSSSFVPFMQLSAIDRRSIIENILDIDVFSNMNVLLKGKMMQLKEVLRNLHNKIEVQNNKIETHKQYLEKIKENTETYKKEIDDNISRLNTSICKLTKEYDDTTTDIARLTESIKSKNSVKQRIEKTKDIRSKFLGNITNLTKKIEFYSENDNCSMCYQSIATDFKNTEIENHKTKKTKLESALTELILEETKITEEYNIISENIDKITSLQILIGKKEANLDNNKKQIQELTTQKINKLEQDKNIENEEQVMVSLKVDLDKLITEKDSIKEDLIYNETVSDLLKDSGVKSKIIKYYLPHINSYINKFLRSMDFFVQFQLDENFNEEIKSRNRDVFSYENFSEGEKMRIDLSLLLAWREIARAKNSVNCNLLILDEVFDSSLDNVGVEEVMKLISSISTGSNIYIISHKSDQLVDKFKNIITFEKKNNFSKMIIH